MDKTGALELQEYELSGAENDVVDLCGRRARTWGVVCIGFGIFTLLVAALQIIGVVGGNGWYFLVPQGRLSVVVGSAFRSAGGSLRTVVTTEGNDIHHLLQALGQFSRAFRI